MGSLGANGGHGSGSAPEAAATASYVFSIMDSSRVSTFFISILLIVYGSFRSLAMEEEQNENDDEDEDGSHKGVRDTNFSFTSADTAHLIASPK